jgi:hypothetical protein
MRSFAASGGFLMLSTLLLCTSVLAFDADSGSASRPDAADRAGYDAARASAGRDPDAQVRLALWCEAHGLTAERVKHLALAVLADPAHATARGLLGLVPYKGQWRTPDGVADKVKQDERLNAAMSEYAARRAKMANTADAHWKLALWCESQGLEPEAKAHLAIVTQLDPGREAAWKRLGYRKVKNRWATDARLAAEKAEADAQKAADKHYRPLLSKWRAWLGEKDPTHRAQAAQAIAALTDPRAVPSIWLTFAAGNSAQQALAVQVLGQIDSPGSTRVLAILAVSSPSAEVRGNAIDTLQRRDPRDFVGFLIGLLRDPVKYEVRPVGGPGSPGALFVNGKRFNVQYLYSPPPMPFIPLFEGEPITYDENGLPVVSRFLGQGVWETPRYSTSITLGQYLGLSPAAPAIQHLIAQAHGSPTSKAQVATMAPGQLSNPANGNSRLILTEVAQTPVNSSLDIHIGQIALEHTKSAAAAQQQLAADIGAIDSYNADLRDANQRIHQVLTAVTGRPSGGKQADWIAWWTDFQGYSYTRPPEEPKPTVLEEVPLAYSPQGQPITTRMNVAGPTTTTAVISHSCFRAGTPVRTLTGDRPIETICAGDQVLVQDVMTGKLSFQPVVGVYHNKPSLLLAIRLGDETISATPIHRFWKVGAGWTMARDLKPGDGVRSLGGVAKVSSIQEASVEPVFNLAVAVGQSFFVGTQKLLVHDNSLVKPVFKPFDAVPELAAIKPSTSGP